MKTNRRKEQEIQIDDDGTVPCPKSESRRINPWSDEPTEKPCAKCAREKHGLPKQRPQ